MGLELGRGLVVGQMVDGGHGGVVAVMGPYVEKHQREPHQHHADNNHQRQISYDRMSPAPADETLEIRSHTAKICINGEIFKNTESLWR